MVEHLPFLFLGGVEPVPECSCAVDSHHMMTHFFRSRLPSLFLPPEEEPLSISNARHCLTMSAKTSSTLMRLRADVS